MDKKIDIVQPTLGKIRHYRSCQPQHSSKFLLHYSNIRVKVYYKHDYQHGVQNYRNYHFAMRYCQSIGRVYGDNVLIVITREGGVRKVTISGIR